MWCKQHNLFDFDFNFYNFIARKDGVKNNFKVNENSYWKWCVVFPNWNILLIIYISGGRGRDLFVIGFTTTYAISSYHN